MDTSYNYILIHMYLYSNIFKSKWNIFRELVILIIGDPDNAYVL